VLVLLVVDLALREVEADLRVSSFLAAKSLSRQDRRSDAGFRCWCLHGGKFRERSGA
jgi:hypothetical protein